MTTKMRRIIEGVTKRQHSRVKALRRDVAVVVGADRAKLAVHLGNLAGAYRVVEAPRPDSEVPPGAVVVMSRATYRDLLERAEDAAAIAAYARTRGEESVPFELIKRLDAGEHPVRVWREHRELTLERLGAKAALSIGYLSEIEAGKKPGSIKALRTIAKALKLDLDDLTAWLK